jgi:hypothetical protein
MIDSFLFDEQYKTQSDGNGIGCGIFIITHDYESDFQVANMQEGPIILKYSRRLSATHTHVFQVCSYD